MTTAAIYARVSSQRQKKDQTIASQTAALRAYVERMRLELPEEWVFEDEGHSGATLMRPALERLRDLIAQVGVDVVVVYAPDRLARKFAYQALLIEEFARAGTRVEFVRGPRGDWLLAAWKHSSTLQRTPATRTSSCRVTWVGDQHR